jgi:hypothetical protein
MNSPKRSDRTPTVKRDDPRPSIDQRNSARQIIAGSFDEHLDTVLNEWCWHRSDGATLAITTTRNDDARLINECIQAERVERGEIDDGVGIPLAVGCAYVRDVVATCRNDRRLVTNSGESVRTATVGSSSQPAGTAVSRCPASMELGLRRSQRRTSPSTSSWASLDRARCPRRDRRRKPHARH